nr:7TM GPCR domain containing protein [Haemonchus contortus]
MLVNLVCCLAAVLGIPANLFVLIAIFYFRDMRTISNIYIGNLAVADLLFLAGTPIVITQSITRDWNFGSVVCKGFVTGNGISQFASAMFIAVLSLDRFLAVCRPTRASVLRTRRAAIAAVVFAWAIVILEITPLFMFVKLIKSSSSPGEGGRHMCLLVTEEDRELDGESAGAERETLFSRKFFTTYTFTLSYLLPLIAIWIFYAKIIRKLWQRRHRMHLKRKMSKRKTTKVTIMGLSIVISYTLCWLPYWLIQWSIALNIGWNRNLSILTCASYAAFALLYINRAVNPFIYVFLSESFKRNVSELVLKNSSVQHKHSNSATVKMLPQQINEGTESV